MTEARRRGSRVRRLYLASTLPALALLAVGFVVFADLSDEFSRWFGPAVDWLLPASVFVLLTSGAMLSLPMLARRWVAGSVAGEGGVGRRFVLVEPRRFVKLALANLAATALNVAPVRDGVVEFVRSAARKPACFPLLLVNIPPFSYLAIVVVAAYVLSPVIVGVVFAIAIVREARGLVVAEWVPQEGYREGAGCQVRLRGAGQDERAMIERVEGDKLVLVSTAAGAEERREVRTLARPDADLLEQLRFACASGRLNDLSEGPRESNDADDP